MAELSELRTKLLHARRQLEAAEVLEHSGLLEQAAAMHWIALRTTVFAWLEQHEILYAGTRDALVAAISDKRLHAIGADLAFAYLIGTMSEWDERFAITSEQLLVFKSRCTNVRRQLES